MLAWMQKNNFWAYTPTETRNWGGADVGIHTHETWANGQSETVGVKVNLISFEQPPLCVNVRKSRTSVSTLHG